MPGFPHFGRARLQAFPSHHDPFAVHGNAQGLVGDSVRSRLMLVEGIDVDRGALGELFHSAFAQPLARLVLDGPNGFVKRSLGPRPWRRFPLTDASVFRSGDWPPRRQDRDWRCPYGDRPAASP